MLGLWLYLRDKINETSTAIAECSNDDDVRAKYNYAHGLLDAMQAITIEGQEEQQEKEERTVYCNLLSAAIKALKDEEKKRKAVAILQKQNESSHRAAAVRSAADARRYIMKEPIGCFIITTADGHTWFADRFEGDTLEKAQADADATFGAGCTVEMR